MCEKYVGNLVFDVGGVGIFWNEKGCFVWFWIEIGFEVIVVEVEVECNVVCG